MSAMSKEVAAVEREKLCRKLFDSIRIHADDVDIARVGELLANPLVDINWVHPAYGIILVSGGLLKCGRPMPLWICCLRMID